MNVNIIDVTRDDLPSLLRFAQDIFYKTFYEVNENKSNYHQYVAEAFTLEAFQKEWDNPHSHFYFIKNVEEIIAYLKLNEKEAFSEEVSGSGLEIQRLYISEKYQGQGLGKTLIDFSENFAQGKLLEFLWLGVWEYNVKAISIYKKCGFTSFGEHDFIFGEEKQKDILMRKEVEN